MNIMQYTQNKKVLVVCYILTLGLGSLVRFLPFMESLISSAVIFILGLLIVRWIWIIKETDKTERMFLLLIFILSQQVFYINLFKLIAE